MNLPINYNDANWKKRKQARLQYIQEQEGMCYHCKCNLQKDPPASVTKYKLNLSLFPDGFLDNPIHLHHDHNTGMTIGAVHAYCNGVLWQYHGE